VQRLDDPLAHVLAEATAREQTRATAGTSAYRLTLEDGGGTVLFALPLFDVDVAHHDGVDAVQMFRELVPWPAGVEVVTVRGDARTLAERPVSAHAPTVQITSPSDGADLAAPLRITWSAEDADGDPVVAMVQYSADDGATWRVVVDGRTGGEVELESLGFFPSSVGLGRIRVTVNDGANTGTDEITGLSLPNSAPAPRILGPGHGMRAFEGEIVSFEGTATDWEDGNLPGRSLTWVSNIDGELGKGEVLDTMDLAPGEHTITLRAEDSDGAAREAEIIIAIVGTLAPDRSEELRRAGARLGVNVDGGGSGGGDDNDARNLGLAAAAGAVAMLILVLLVRAGERLRHRNRA
jgi:hypothetical protein